jgi:ribosomal protein S15P/S13E
MATLDQLETALRNADAVGANDDAHRIAAEIVRMRGAPGQQPAQAAQPSLYDQAIAKAKDIFHGVPEAAGTISEGAFYGALAPFVELGMTFANPDDPRSRSRGTPYADEFLRRNVHQPTTDTGKAIVGAVSDVFGAMPAVFPELGALGEAASYVSPANLKATGSMAATAGKDIARNAAEMGKTMTVEPIKSAGKAVMGTKPMRAISGAVARDAQEEIRRQAITASHKGIEEADKALASVREKQYDSYTPYSTKLSMAQDAVDKVKRASRDTVANHEQALVDFSPTAMRDDEAGAVAQQLAKSNIDKMIAAREREAITLEHDPAFDAARHRQAIGEWPSAEGTSSGDTLKALRAEVKRDISSRTAEGQPVRAGMQKVLTMITETEHNRLGIDVLESIRRELRNPMVGDPEGLAAMGAKYLDKYADSIEEAMRDFEPGTGRYIDKYREHSEKIRDALGGKAGENVIETLSRTSEEFNQPTASVYNRYLGSGADGASRLLRIVGGKSQKLLEVVKANLRRRVEGMDAKQMREWMGQDKTQGLLEVFPEAKQGLASILRHKEEQSILNDHIKEATDHLETVKKDVASMQKEAKAKVEEIEGFKRDMQLLDQEFAKADPKEVVPLALTAAKRAAKSGMITPEQYGQFLEATNKATRLYGNTKKAQQAIRNATVLAGLYTTGHYLGYVIPKPH